MPSVQSTIPTLSRIPLLSELTRPTTAATNEQLAADRRAHILLTGHAFAHSFEREREQERAAATPASARCSFPASAVAASSAGIGEHRERDVDLLRAVRESALPAGHLRKSQVAERERALADARKEPGNDA